ncbi:MAG: cation:proton antiporter [Actinomycetota bacterium]
MLAVETTSTLFLELGGVLIGLAILARVANRFRLSPVPLFLLAGLAFGEGGVVPLVTAEGFIQAGAQIGVILLLFVLGLEYGAQDLVQGLRRRAGSGLADLVLNFTPGMAAALLLDWGLLPAVFLGGITYVSSSGIVSHLLTEGHWKGTPESKSVVSILVLEDLVMAVYLAFTAVLVSGRGPVVGVASVCIAIVVVAAVLWIALRFGDALSRLVFSKADQPLVLLIIGITLVAAALADRLQISAEVGAFLVGLTLSGRTAERARRVLGPVKDLFSAFFFVFFGFGIDPSGISPVLLVALALALVTAGTKILTGIVSARMEGADLRAGVRAGVLLIPRGEFSIAIAGIAIVAGLEPEIAPLAATYVLVLAIAGPLLARAIGRAASDPSVMHPD